jgi:hypothetical protein
MEICILLQAIHWNSLIKEEKYGRLKKKQVRAIIDFLSPYGFPEVLKVPF